MLYRSQKVLCRTQKVVCRSKKMLCRTQKAPYRTQILRCRTKKMMCRSKKFGGMNLLDKGVCEKPQCFRGVSCFRPTTDREPLAKILA